MKATRSISWIISILVCATVIYIYRTPISLLLSRTLLKPAPCSQPIYYKLGTVDTRFGISKTTLLEDISKASNVWSQAENNTLFAPSATGTLVINLIYDYRQQATDKLEDLGININDDRATYDGLKARYTSLTKKYASDKASFASSVDQYNVAQDAYNKDVSYWNSRGGAPAKEYARLDQQKNALKQQAQDITQAQNSLNTEVDQINSVVTVINRLAHELNLTVETYNNIGASTGQEFDEGEYVQTSTTTEINIYQYNNNTSLIRVFEHELGHALGLNHVDDPKAIMYRLNQATNESLAPADVAELLKVCHNK